MSKNRRKIFLFFALLAFCNILCAPPLYCRGAAENEEQTAINNEWLLCVTAFDFTSLPPARRIAGDVITRNLVDKLKAVSYRLRVSPEYAYYENYAWQQSVVTAAKALSQKQEERSRELFKGEADWRYRASLKRIDGEIVKLKEALVEKEAERPLVNNEPAFGLCSANTTGTYPAAPAAGAERRFCQTQKADAFLSGEVSEFHGRYYVNLRLYALYTNSFVYEDDIIFSMEDTDGAVEEITARLTAVLSGNKPAAITVKADPPESQVLINKNFAGRGTVTEREHPPGIVTVAVAAEGHTPQSVETKLVPGEIAEIEVKLSPFYYSGVDVDVPGKTSVSVYQGALYAGEAPLTLRLPIDQLDYITVETGDGEAARAVFFAPGMPGETAAVSLKTKIQPPAGEQRVNKARRRYYWAWGGTWIAGIVAWIAAGIYQSYEAVPAGSAGPDLVNARNTMNIVQIGGIALVGAAVVHEFIQMGRYIFASTEGATPIVRQERAEK